MNALTDSRRSRFFWVAVLYFAEGLPFGLYTDVFPVAFREHHASLTEIGFISLLGLPWTLKFLWAPAIDHFRRHRLWMLGADLLMGATLMLSALHFGFGRGALALIGIFTLLAATNDIAIDGYTLELLPVTEMGMGNGLRIGFYRAGMLAAGLVLIVSTTFGWGPAYVLAAILLVINGLACRLAPHEPTRPSPDHLGITQEIAEIMRHPGALAATLALVVGALALANEALGWSRRDPAFWPIVLAASAVLWLLGWWQRLPPSRLRTQGPLFGALLEMLERPGILPVFAFIVLYRLGDGAIGYMIKPFWVDHGFTAAQIGAVSVIAGIALSVLGGFAGGYITDRLGISRALWILGIAQVAPNLGYALCAHLLPIQSAGLPIPMTHVALLYSVSAAESFAGGLGTAAFLAFLMAIVRRERSATEFALLSSLFAVTIRLAGFASGYGTKVLGYTDYFLLTFFLGFPALIFLPAARRMLAYINAGTGSEQS